MHFLHLLIFSQVLRARPLSEAPLLGYASPGSRPTSASTTSAQIKVPLVGASTISSLTTTFAKVPLKERDSAARSQCLFFNGAYICPNWPTACVPNISLDSCTGECLTNNSTTRCTDILKPYCFVVVGIDQSGVTISDASCDTLSPDLTTTTFLSTNGSTSPTATSSSSEPFVASTSGVTSATSEPGQPTAGGGTAVPTANATPAPGPAQFPTDFSTGGKVGCALGGSFVVGLVLCWLCLKGHKKGEQASKSPTANEKAAGGDNISPEETKEITQESTQKVLVNEAVDNPP